MTILGISAYFHDSAAGIIQGGLILAAAEEERFSRIKHDKRFPTQAVAWCLEETGLCLDDLDAVVFYEKPFLKFERILESFYAIAPRGFSSFLQAMPHWFGEKLFLKARIIKALKKVGPLDSKSLRLLFPEHHLSHAAGSYFLSGFDEAAILTVDGVGEWATTTISHATGNHIRMLREQRFPHSVGLLYSAFTQFLGFRVNHGEYKLMGLAAYGNPHAEETKTFIYTIKTTLLHISEDGSIELNGDFFGFLDSDQTINPAKWESLFGMTVRTETDQFSHQHANLAQAIQFVTEEIILRLAQEVKRLTGSPRLCLSGGVALNCVANGALQRSGIFKEIFVQPAPGDSGAALGAALAAHSLLTQQPSIRPQHRLPLYGPELCTTDVLPLCEQHQLECVLMEMGELLTLVASEIANGKVIGWCQGRMEFGPRALGNRSILGDPRNPDMQTIINLKVKKRESFRPFAPAIMAEELSTYFEMEQPSGWMQFVQPMRSAYLLPLPADFKDWSVDKQLSTPKSQFPAITHADGSSRLQSVDRTEHPLFYELLAQFHKLTGCPMLINTSFNLRGEPIVCGVEDAITCFLHTELDLLVIGNYIITKPDSFLND